MTSALEFKNAEPRAVRKTLGVIGERLYREINGISCLELEEITQEKKSVMVSRSFGATIEALSDLEVAVANFVARAAEKVRRMGLLSSSMVVMLRTNRFKPEEEQYSQNLRCTFENPTASTSELIRIAGETLQRIYRPGYRYKKAGVLLEGLVSKSSFQPSLFPAPTAAPRADLDELVDRINRRFGSKNTPAITRAAMLCPEGVTKWKARTNQRSPNYTTSWKELPVIHAD